MTSKMRAIKRAHIVEALRFALRFVLPFCFFCSRWKGDYLCEALEAAVVELGGSKEDEAAVIVCCEGARRGDHVKVEMSVQTRTSNGLAGPSQDEVRWVVGKE